jgi:drug/metabolite transporter (DMT)-like permease
VTLLGPLLLREQPRRSDLLVLLLIGAGMTLFFIAPATSTATAPEPRLGDLAAIASGCSYGLLLVGFRWLGRAGAGEQESVVAWGNLTAAPLALALAPLCGQTSAAGARAGAAVRPDPGGRRRVELGRDPRARHAAGRPRLRAAGPGHAAGASSPHRCR